jgi:integrase
MEKGEKRRPSRPMPEKAFRTNGLRVDICPSNAVQIAVQTSVYIMPKLTKRLIDASEARPAKYTLWDTELRGFGLAVEPTGTKIFVLRYRTVEGRDRRPSIGRYGVLTVDQAREEARALLVEVAKGKDPLAVRQQKRAGATMAELFDRYLKEHVDVRLRPTSRVSIRHLVEKHLRPALGAIKVEAFTRQDAYRLHYSLRETPTSANRALAALSKALSLAEEWGLRPEGINPCAKVRMFQETARDRFLSVEEVKQLGATLILAETVGLPWVVDETKAKAKHLARPENRIAPLDPAIVTVVRLLLLTGARKREITELRWSDVDFEFGTLALPRQKGKDRVPHVVATAAMDILGRWPKTAGTEWVFPRALDPSRPIATEVIQNGWERIRHAAGIADVRMHDLRHTFGTTASRSGANAFMIRDMLRHANVSMSSRYVNPDSEPQRVLAEAVGDMLSSALAGEEAKVVSIADWRRPRAASAD